ncbi:hypothetical protein M430DRAFT_237893 [Amorphotheca resinae ATCC 22711]|uniref:Uncharacterized protein n=1 Tax=Amorphotheca resinae ATCC 22711 TaxID=857342 RepID=A0A2T3B192_AMORE|nr:hypothetical protein M430DRAFT_237893 [Amorphotheca resinae ATCC 22711]PSS18330.1 hypothetical protein M430DRAFT_237893 [Amorphotheca resinae ATCC 22711]
MSTTPRDVERCSTFHSNGIALANEIILHIPSYVSIGTQLLPLGGGVGTRRAHHPIASVSRHLRAIYLSQPYLAPADNTQPPVPCTIGGALQFDDLCTLVSFFEGGPGQDTNFLREIRGLNVSYKDSFAVSWWQETTNYAFEAFELLYKRWHLMSVSWLRIHLRCTKAILSVDDPGIWSLLKIRGLPRLEVVGPRRCISPLVRKYLKARTRSQRLFPWRPLGVENPGPKEWTALVKDRSGIPRWQAQFEWLEARYKYLHDRETIAARCKEQRTTYRKQLNRWPMLSKRRRRRGV